MSKFKAAITSGAITLVGGIFFAWTSDQQALDVQAELAIKFQEQNLEPEEAATLQKINEEGIGILNLTKDDLDMSQVRTDGDVFVHYTANEYKTARDGWLDKALDGELNPNEFYRELGAYLKYEGGPITIKNSDDPVRDALQQIKDRPVSRKERDPEREFVID